MCGFAAVIALHGATAEVDIAKRMADVLRHRGPDDSGTYASGGVAFGFRRLSILDLSPSGHQPLASDDGELVIVFNGEIYNYVEVRAELIERGHRFLSTGDTEVLLHAYQQWGTECLPRLNGMWAFLIHDRRRGIVFGSRDRFGVKPLYRHDARGRILLASEIKAFLASGLYEPKTNWPRVAHLLCHGDHSVDPSGETFYEDVVEVPPGSSFELSLDGRSSTRRFWSLDRLEPASDEAPPRAFRDLFEDAVRLRMRSDVPVGVSLSGGLDSTSIVSAMARLLAAEPGGLSGGSLKAFSYGSPEFDESQYIAATITETRAELHRVDTSTAELWQRLDEVLWYQDEPLHSATALIGFEIYRLASANGVKVVLTGQGADEVLGGYPSYFAHYWAELARRGAARAAWREIGAYCAVHGGSQGALFRRVMERRAREVLYQVGPLRRLAARRTRHHNPLAASWYAPELLHALPRDDDRSTNGSLRAVLRRSVERESLPLYLRIEDRNSMAHSVEARLPFLDYRLVSLAFQMPAVWKLRGPWNKYVLREAMRGRIPEIVRIRPDKMGFPTSVAQWFRGSFYDALQDTLASEAARTRGIYNIPAIRADLERHRRGEVDFGGALFDVAQLERWLQPRAFGALTSPIAP
jgi:asparagine synthase (glutamine-hydrolysing)